jgi:hypothetical protein
MGSQRNYYLAVSDQSAPQVVMIRFVGQDQDRALQRFEVSRENAMAAHQQNWRVGR